MTFESIIKEIFLKCLTDNNFEQAFKHEKSLDALLSKLPKKVLQSYYDENLWKWYASDGKASSDHKACTTEVELKYLIVKAEKNAVKIYFHKNQTKIQEISQLGLVHSSPAATVKWMFSSSRAMVGYGKNFIIIFQSNKTLNFSTTLDKF